MRSVSLFRFVMGGMVTGLILNVGGLTLVHFFLAEQLKQVMASTGYICRLVGFWQAMMCGLTYTCNRPYFVFARMMVVVAVLWYRLSESKVYFGLIEGNDSAAESHRSGLGTIGNAKFN